MNEEKTEGLRHIRRALLSVSDKTGLVDFARELQDFGVEILSTGGTAKALREAGLKVRDVSDVTGFPEMLDGRVKTLHPRIHGGILAVRDNPDHARALEEHDIGPIDLVVINLYPFERTVARDGVTYEEAVEQIDIGGPAIVRSAAKNHADVAVVVSVEDYETLVAELQKHEGATTLALRTRLARRAFMRTASYDMAIAAYFAQSDARDGVAFKSGESVTAHVGSSGFAHAESLSVDGSRVDSTLDVTELPRSIEEFETLPSSARWRLNRDIVLRYGENPHQRAALYRTGARGGIGMAEVLSGKEMSYNNYVDADAAWQLVCDFDETACAIIKHTNPSGVGTASSLEEAYRRAFATDPVSAFGGIVAFNRVVDEGAARALTEIFTEVVVAPDFDESAIEILKSKKNLRVLRAGEARRPIGLEFKQITGGMLIQTRDTHRLRREDLKVVTRRAPTVEEIDALLFAWTVCKHTKSNAIVYARAGQTVGVGAGQMSRVDSVRLGAMRSRLEVKGSVLASDAFFPFRDGLDEAAGHGISAIIQPGGSVRDGEVIAAADEHGLAMVFTGIRHFKH
jgi:phosphoribosylaminoimidazolecarboxamide formyltransferase/IMP cyclohydrolase